MRKFFVVSLVILAILCLASPCFCAANSWGNTDTNLLLKKVVPSYLQSLGTGLDGSRDLMVTTDTVIPLTYDTVKITISARTVTLANGTKGQILTLQGIDRMAGTLYIQPATSTGWQQITMDSDGETATLRYIDSTYGWVIVGVVDATVTKRNSTTN